MSINIPKNTLKNRLWLLLLAFMALIIISSPTISFLNIISKYFIHLVGIFFLTGLIGYIINNTYVLLLGFGLCTIICLQLKNESETAFKNKSYANEEKINIALINLSDVKNTDDLFNLIAEKNPEIINFIEVTPDWVDILQAKLSTNYNYNLTQPTIDFYGKAFFSKHKIISDLNMTKDLSITIQHNLDTILLISSYITPSLDNMSIKNAAQQFNIISDLVVDTNYPALVFGQFNHVYWSPEIKNFKTMSGLKNCRNSSLPSGNEIQNELSFHNHHFNCFDIKDLRFKNGNKIGIFASYIKTNAITKSNLKSKK